MRNLGQPNELCGERERAIRIEFVAENPFATNYVGTRRGRDKGPGLVESEGIEFFLHGMAPIRVTKGGKIIVRKGGRGYS